jgi:tripartite-type tricarboxylate transporter receptor subunit TctC
MRYQRLANSLGLNRYNARLTRAAADGHAQHPYRSCPALALIATSCAVLSLALEASAAYPERPLRYIVPFAAGSGGDITARLLAAELGKQMGQLIVADNRPGAGGSIGTELIVRAPADGYTIGHSGITVLAIDRSVRAKLPYDPDKDLKMIVQGSFQPNMLAVSPLLPIQSVKDMIDYARKNPGKLSWGSDNGGSPHLSGELFKHMTGTNLLHVPYKSSPQAMTDLIGGRLQFSFDNMSFTLPHVKAGRVRAIGVSGPKRTAVIPELPTIAEGGVAGFEVVSWTGVVAPAGVPRAIVETLNTMANKALASAALKEKYTALGYEIAGGTPEQFAELVRKEAAKWAEVAKRAGMKVD